MKIKDLPDDIKYIALANQLMQGNEINTEVDLNDDNINNNFNWGETFTSSNKLNDSDTNQKESEYWSDICDGNTNIINPNEHKYIQLWKLLNNVYGNKNTLINTEIINDEEYIATIGSKKVKITIKEIL